MLLREVMTEAVVTASPRVPVREVAALMRERNVGSVVLVDDDDLPVGFITDRDLTVQVLAGGGGPDAAVAAHASAPVVTGTPEMSVQDAVDLMADHGIRRLPVVDDGRLHGIVTLDDLAVRIGDLTLAQSVTARLTRAALPGFYFHTRGE